MASGQVIVKVGSYNLGDKSDAMQISAFYKQDFKITLRENARYLLLMPVNDGVGSN